jgi:predicted permease
VASGGYFEAMDIPLIRGRLFDDGDRAGAPMVVLINETMTRQFWPGADPIGSRIRTGGMDRYGAIWTTVIGVVGDVRHDDLAAGTQPEYFVPYRQRPDRAQQATVVIEASTPPSQLVQPVNEQLRALDPDVPAEFMLMRDRVSASVSDRRFTMLILSGFAGVALVLAAVGIYGVVSYSVERRRREIGIRIALGARPEGVLALMMRRSMAVVLIGMAVGAVGTAAITRVMRRLLFSVSPTDPLTLACVVLLLLAVAALASWIPARRGTRVDPLVTMRSE